MRQAVRARLKCSADDHDDRAGEDSLPTTEIVADPNAEDGTEETAQVVGSGCDTCEVRMLEVYTALLDIPWTPERVLFSA